MLRSTWLAAAWLGCTGLGIANADEPKTKDYDITATLMPDALHAGDKGKVSLTIHPHAPWQLKPSTPFTATLSATAGVKLEKTTLTSKDFADPKATDKVLVAPFAVTASGAQSIASALNFFICTDQVCVRYKETVETKIDVR